MKCVDCSANALFKSHGNIRCSSWPSSLLDELLMYKSDSNNTSNDTTLIQKRDQQTQQARDETL